jgi:hypothetical protein
MFAREREDAMSLIFPRPTFYYLFERGRWARLRSSAGKIGAAFLAGAVCAVVMAKLPPGHGSPGSKAAATHQAATAPANASAPATAAKSETSGSTASGTASASAEPKPGPVPEPAKTEPATTAAIPEPAKNAPAPAKAAALPEPAPSAPSTPPKAETTGVTAAAQQPETARTAAHKVASESAPPKLRTPVRSIVKRTAPQALAAKTPVQADRVASRESTPARDSRDGDSRYSDSRDSALARASASTTVGEGEPAASDPEAADSRSDRSVARSGDSGRGKRVTKRGSAPAQHQVRVGERDSRDTRDSRDSDDFLWRHREARSAQPVDADDDDTAAAVPVRRYRLPGGDRVTVYRVPDRDSAPQPRVFAPQGLFGFLGFGN